MSPANLHSLSDPHFSADTAAWLAAIVEDSADAILSKTLDGTITSWNAGAERLFGHSREEAVGRPIGLIIPEDRLHEEADIVARLRLGERIGRFETVRCTREALPVHVEVTISPLRSADGTIIGASTIARDIGDRLRHANEQALLLSEMRHRVKNLLSIVQGLICIGSRRTDDVHTFTEQLTARITSLAAAQTLGPIDIQDSQTGQVLIHRVPRFERRLVMGVKRYELSEAQWMKIAPLLPGKSSDPGRTGSDNRLFVNGCLWVLRSGAHCA